MSKHYTKVYLPEHIVDRLKKYEQDENIEEAVALIRLVDIGLGVIEDTKMKPAESI